jgi:effector-binding domain-containing protein
VLFHHCDYREQEADVEACIPVREPLGLEGVDFRRLPGGTCLSLTQSGSYTQLGNAYERLFCALNSGSHELVMPIREIYHRGPGMVSRGNARQNLSDIQLFFK